MFCKTTGSFGVDIIVDYCSLTPYPQNCRKKNNNLISLGTSCVRKQANKMCYDKKKVFITDAFIKQV